MDIQSLALIEGDLPKLHEQARYVAVRVSNGSPGLYRTIVRLRPHQEHSSKICADLGAKYRDLTFVVSASGRIENTGDGFELFRGTALWCDAIHVANALRTKLGVCVTTKSVASPPE